MTTFITILLIAGYALLLLFILDLYVKVGWVAHAVEMLGDALQRHCYDTETVTMTRRELIFLKAAAQLWSHFPRNQLLPEEVRYTLNLDSSPVLTDRETELLIAHIDRLIGAASK